MNLHPSAGATLAIQSGSGPFSVSVDVPIVTAAIDQNARTVTVTASTQTGRATIVLSDSSGATIQIPVRVALDAGTAPPAATVRVTGSQLDPQWLMQQIQRVVLPAVQTQPGATAQLGAFTLPATLGPGASAVVPVPVQVAGGDQYFDVNAWTSVTVQNVAADPFSTPLLFYDDDPEKLIADGVLFRGEVQPNAPARLYYYHQNAEGSRQLAVVLSSGTAQPSTVQIIDASAGPNIDVMSVGHAVSRDFLIRKPLNEGIVVDVAAQNPYVADQFAMDSLAGAAGSLGIRIVDGGPVTVTVLALPAGPITGAEIAGYLSQPQLPDDGHHRTGIFALSGYGTQTIAFTVPGPDAGTQYGAQTPPAAAIPNVPIQTGHDYGEYGVLRLLNFQISNPLDRNATVYLYERPLGGPVRGSFLVNGRLAEVGCARVPDRYQIGAPIAVQAHGTLTVPVQTMTDGGSNYPLEVGVTSTQPQPNVPPMYAPDGCFPKSGAPATPAPEPTG